MSANERLRSLQLCGDVLVGLAVHGGKGNPASSCREDGTGVQAGFQGFSFAGISVQDFPEPLQGVQLPLPPHLAHFELLSVELLIVVPRPLHREHFPDPLQPLQLPMSSLLSGAIADRFENRGKR